MSLVDYASSSEDEEIDKAQRLECFKEEKNEPEENSPMESTATVASRTTAPVDPTRPCTSFVGTMGNLPDATLLLSSPSFDNSHHSTLHKRASNGSAFLLPLSKHPRGNLPHSRTIPDTAGGVLIPPQLRGRSNVVTQDINNLFVQRRQQGESSP